MKKYEIINQTEIDINTKDIYNIIKITMKKFKIKNPIFNIIFVNNNTIRSINKKYRKIDKETDVITFALEDDSNIKYNNIRVLGDIYISIDKATKQSKEYGHSLKREICFLTVHGLLHLLGYDHINEKDRKIMRELEECVLNEYDVKR